MDRVLLTETNKTEIRAPFPNYLSPSPPLPPLLSVDGIIGRISPSILLVIVILGFIFVISGLLHLLVRYLIRRSTTDQDDQDSATALQGQLQQLFHLHDAGVDQSFIDTLPVFPYKDITGVKDPFDCAVCLCEFEADDKLRLLPECSHAFHMECIDTWLLSHSTCPLCRTSLLPDFAPGHNCTPFVLLLESGSESSRETVEEDPVAPSAEEPPGKARDFGEKGAERTTEPPPPPPLPPPPSRLVPIKLGKLRSVDGASEGSSSDNRVLDGRRCFSMGSFEYVMDETSRMHVTVKQPARKPGVKKPGHRPAISECDCNPRREGLKGFETGESFSVSKIWLRSKKEKKPAGEVSSRRVFSFRLPLQMGGAAERGKVKCGSSRRTAASEVDLACYDKSGSDLGSDLEAAGCDGDNVVSRGEETPSFARRTLLWISGRHHKVGNHSESGRIPSSGPILFSNFSGDEVAEGGTK
ncbi:unnamed protein product [Spirodela intermedia]|uniref:RING-type E3 ubiquitin transferase n=1 Tax=Spirodela intermedia TaxID=51605 RepID=A0A7I8LFU9_SPIIN|nr:unnamed protein product [Spirodela intermedia]